MNGLHQTEYPNLNAHQHDHTQCRETMLVRARKICADRGVQLTLIRAQVLELIWASHRAVKAYDLLDDIKPLQPAAKPATIYRALDFLLEQGLIHRIESLNAFIGCGNSGQNHDQLMLICERCHEVEERSAANVMTALSAEIRQAGFQVHSKAIEIQGVCAKCGGMADTPGQESKSEVA